MREPVRRETARQAVVEVLSSNGLAADAVADDRWLTVLPGEWKRTIPLLLDLDDRTLTVSSLLAGAPDEGHAQVYELLLRRNQHAGPVHFALDDDGGIVLTGQLPIEAVDTDHVDQLLGRVLELADGTFNAVLRSGFASYLGAEQRWRASAGLPPNPVGDPDPAGPDPDAPERP